jgi:arginyl-tRNA--protein-N-Asp/Glu arginylyltransferase
LKRELHDVLTNAGFRRSQNIAYRPSCDACDACISARVPVEKFEFSRRWRKIMLRNADLTRALRPAQATEEQFFLLRRYLGSRHADGGMAEMSFTDFASMVEESAVHTHIVEYRYSDGANKGESRGRGLRGCARRRPLDGLFVLRSRRSDAAVAGVYIILDHIQQARASGFSFLYLGYWIPGSDKMNYKAEFRPLELLLGGEWRPYEPVQF